MARLAKWGTRAFNVLALLDIGILDKSGFTLEASRVNSSRSRNAFLNCSKALPGHGYTRPSVLVLFPFYLFFRTRYTLRYDFNDVMVSAVYNSISDRLPGVTRDNEIEEMVTSLMLLRTFVHASSLQSRQHPDGPPLTSGDET